MTIKLPEVLRSLNEIWMSKLGRCYSLENKYCLEFLALSFLTSSLLTLSCVSICSRRVSNITGLAYLCRILNFHYSFYRRTLTLETFNLVHDDENDIGKKRSLLCSKYLHYFFLSKYFDTNSKDSKSAVC